MYTGYREPAGSQNDPVILQRVGYLSVSGTRILLAVRLQPVRDRAEHGLVRAGGLIRRQLAIGELRQDRDVTADAVV